MSDDTAIKIMQSLGLDYNPAINSTLQFQKTVGGLNTELENMKKLAIESAKDINNAFSSQLGNKSGNNDIANQFKTVKQEAQATATTIGKMAKEIRESNLVNMQAQAAYVQQRVSAKGLSDEYGKQATTLRDQLSVIQARLQTEGKLSAEETEQTAQLKEQLDILRAQTRAASHDENRLNPPIPENEFENKASWFTDGAKFYAITKAAKEASSTIKDVEMGMIEISRVMDDTSFVFDDYRDKLFKLGVDYGQTFENVQSVALRWAQSGYNVADSLTLTETSMLALNTAELDATNATESMIGIMAQWGLQAEDLALVMDKVNKTADNYSLTSQDLVDGLLRSSGAAKVMGMSLDDTIATLTVLRETTGRAGAEVGNALSSILSYIQRPKSIDVLESLGIRMFADEAETEFRNVMEVFDELSQKWQDPSMSEGAKDALMAAAQEAGLFAEELANTVGMQEEFIEMTEKATEAQGQFTDIEKRDAAQAAAGVYRRNYFIALLEKFSTTQDVLNGLVDAGGYSLSENAKTMETLEKKQQSLQASTEALAVAIGDAGLGDALSSVVQGGTVALNAINKLDKGSKDLILGALTTFTAVKTLQVGMKTFGVELPGVTQMIGSLTSGTWSLTAALKAGASGIGAFVVANAPLLALSAAVGIIMAVTNAVKKQKEEQARAIETSKQNIKSLENQKQGLQELSREYDTLKSKEQNLTATTEEKARLKKIQQELVELYGVSITGVDAEGQAYSDSAEAIRDKIKAMEEEKAFEEYKLETSVMSNDTNTIKQLEKDLAERERIALRMAEVQADVDMLQDALNNPGAGAEHPVFEKFLLDPSDVYQNWQIRDIKEQMAADLRELQTASTENNSAIRERTQDRLQLLRSDASRITQQLSKDGVEVTDKTRAYVMGMAKGFSESTDYIDVARDKFQKAIKEFNSSDLDEWTKKYDEAMSKGDTKGVEKASEEISKLVQKFTDGKPELDEFKTSMEDAFNGKMIKIEDINSMEQYNAILETLTDNFDDATSSLGDYRKILDELNSKEGLSVQTKQNIVSKHQELRPYLSDEQALRRELIKIILEEEKTQRDAYAKMMTYTEDFFDLKIRGNAELVSALSEYYNTDFGNFKSLADAKGKVEVELVSQLSGIWAQYYGAIKRGNSNTEAMLEDMVMKKRGNWQEANDVLSTLHKVGDMENAFNNIALDLGGTDFKGSGSKAKKGSGSKKEKKEENKALQESLKLLEHRKRISEETQGSIRNELAELQRISSLYVKTDQERMDMAERIYAVEKRLRDRTLQDSLAFITEKKNFNEMSVEDEIAALTRVRENQVDNINAVKHANLELYKLKKQQAQDAYNQEEGTIQHLTKLSVLSTEQQIEQYRKLYTFKVTSLAEEQKRTENLFNLYKSLISDQQKSIKDAHDNRIKQIDDERKAAIERVESESKARKDAQDEVIKGIEKELALLNKQEDEYDHDKKMADLREQLAYWEVRTSEDARKKVIDLKKQIDEAEHKREVELQRQALEEKRKTAQDEINNIEDSSREEIEIIEETARKDKEIAERSYKEIEIAFDSHKIDMIALASTMSEGMFDKFKENYLDKIQDALTSGDYGSIGGILGDMDGFFDETSDFVGDYGNGWAGSGSGQGSGSGNQSNPNDAKIYNLASTIAELKKQYALGNNPDAPSFTKPLYEELSKLSPDISDYLRDNDYVKAEEYVKRLPTMHEGGKSLSYGAVYMKPGELTFPPGLSAGLERLFPLLSNLGKSNITTETGSFTDGRKEIKIESLLRIDKNYMEDEVDERSLSRELQRQLTNLM